MNYPDGVYISAFYHEESNVLSVSAESFIIIFVCRYCDLNIELFFLNNNEPAYPYAIHVDLLQGLKYIMNSKSTVRIQVRKQLCFYSAMEKATVKKTTIMNLIKILTVSLERLNGCLFLEVYKELSYRCPYIYHFTYSVDALL